MEIPKMSDIVDLPVEEVENKDDNKGRTLIDLSSAKDSDLMGRDEVNKNNAELLAQSEADKQQALDTLFADIFQPPQMNMHVIASMVTQLNPVEDIANTFGVNRDELIKFVEDSTNMEFTSFISRFQSKPKAQLRSYLMESAENLNPQTLIWLSKQLLGYKEHPEEKKDGVVFVTTPDLGELPE